MEIAIAIGANLLIGAILLALFAWRRPPLVARIGVSDIALSLIRESIPDAEGTLALSSDGEAALLIGSDRAMTCLLRCHGDRLTSAHQELARPTAKVAQTLSERERATTMGARCGGKLKVIASSNWLGLPMPRRRRRG